MQKPMSPPRQQYLYLALALDESEAGYSIHKIDVSDFDPDDADDDLDSRPRRPLDPPVLRVEAEHESAACCFVALGTKIFAMLPSSSPGRAAFALDTRTMAIATGPLPSSSCFVVVGDRLYGMRPRESGPNGSCRFEVLGFSNGSRCWSWSSVPSPPPFDPINVRSYAVHPDGRTVFFSVPSSHSDLDPPFQPSPRSGNDDDRRGATFSFNTEALKWTFRGYWSLPFCGQGHYDVELDAWVAIHGEHKGHLCCCDVLPPATGDEDVDRQPLPPARKLARDKLFRIKGGRRRHSDGTLVYMGSSSFCFLERVTDKVLTREQRKRLELDGRQPRLLLYVRTFGVKYDKKGRLRMATCGRRARCYILPEGTSCHDLFISLRALWV